MIHDSPPLVERLRKPVSALIAVSLILAAVVTVPKSFGSWVYDALQILGFFLLIGAGLGRIWCSIYIAGRKNTVLCTDGPYSLCRNPLYLFSFIGALGLFLALQSVLLTLIAALFFLLYYRFVIKSEEKRLLEIFGASFSTYLSTTPRFFPRFSNYHRDSEERMTSIKVIERNLREVLWFFVAIPLIDVIEIIHDQGYLIFGRVPF
ncbi:methyltransferase family protein [Puniceicoccus vermicola]|uniref:Isoprenylcysteine carboxylmethyltransferase family protein n=2 Tax=Puniceicoccus vermicola TaxID=388746 RepID=A0A7X1AZ55_9BACT|nr:isoprenylcysteine carboxylmethyltransferase family protein [Puniceicoccus vermicola]MBC2601633.1 isoprenylcysteine carboxylmethyltransferase family protein [Puniceicoccus vermicola]